MDSLLVINTHAEQYNIHLFIKQAFFHCFNTFQLRAAEVSLLHLVDWWRVSELKGPQILSSLWTLNLISWCFDFLCVCVCVCDCRATNG